MSEYKTREGLDGNIHADPVYDSSDKQQADSYVVREGLDGNWHVSPEPSGYTFIEVIIAVLRFLAKPFLVITVLVLLFGLIVSLVVSVQNSKLSLLWTSDKPEAEQSQVSLIENISVWDLDIAEDTAIYGSNWKEDSYGNQYSGEFREYCSWPGHEPYTVINLSRQDDFKRLTGTIFTRPTQEESLRITFKIYADGKCVFDSGEMHTSTRAIQISIPISGVKQLRFVASSPDEGSGENAAVIFENALVHYD